MDRDEALNQLKHNLASAQQHIKKFANKKWRIQSFTVGEWVFLKLRPHGQQLVVRRFNRLPDTLVPLSWWYTSIVKTRCSSIFSFNKTYQYTVFGVLKEPFYTLLLECHHPNTSIITDKGLLIIRLMRRLVIIFKSLNSYTYWIPPIRIYPSFCSGQNNYNLKNSIPHCIKLVNHFH